MKKISLFFFMTIFIFIFSLSLPKIVAGGENNNGNVRVFVLIRTLEKKPRKIFGQFLLKKRLVSAKVVSISRVKFYRYIRIARDKLLKGKNIRTKIYAFVVWKNKRLKYIRTDKKRIYLLLPKGTLGAKIK